MERNSTHSIIELNVGGVLYVTTLSTINKYASSLIARCVLQEQVQEKGLQAVPKEFSIIKQDSHKYVIDRDGQLFRYVLDFLRNDRLILPEEFRERGRLRQEAEFYELPELVDAISGKSKDGVDRAPASITVGYRGTFSFGRDATSDVKFRKLSRILVCGRVNVCREVFGDTLNESRDPDRGDDGRYSSRFYLKHNCLEQTFDMLYDVGFKLITSCGSGTSASIAESAKETEESKWQHYNEFVFVRE